MAFGKGGFGKMVIRKIEIRKIEFRKIGFWKIRSRKNGIRKIDFGILGGYRQKVIFNIFDFFSYFGLYLLFYDRQHGTFLYGRTCIETLALFLSICWQNKVYWVS